MPIVDLPKCIPLFQLNFTTGNQNSLLSPVYPGFFDCICLMAPGQFLGHNIVYIHLRGGSYEAKKWRFLYKCFNP